MALEIINIGQTVNDGTGDDLRSAFEKVIKNFQYLEDIIPRPTVAENVGVSGQGIFKEKLNNTLYFKSLVGSDNIEIQTTDNNILISTTEGLDLKNFDIENVGDLFVKGRIVLDPNSPSAELIGTTTGNHVGTMQGTVYAPVGTFGLQGNVVGRNPNVGILNPNYQPATVDGIAVKDLNTSVIGFDFGGLSGVYQTGIQYLLEQIGVDMGTISSPNNISIDYGNIV